MKEYMKPDLEYIIFKMEDILSYGDSTDEGVSNDFTDDDFGT